MTHRAHLHNKNDAQSEMKLKNKSLQGVLVGGITVSSSLYKCEGGINLLWNWYFEAKFSG